MKHEIIELHDVQIIGMSKKGGTVQPRFKFNTVGLFTNDNKATVVEE